MGMQRFEVQFPAIFIVFGNESKSCSKLVINQVAGALGISNQFYWLKSLMGTEFFSPCRPPSFWLRVKKKSGSQSCFYEPEIRKASRHWISGHRYTSFKCVSKLLWVWSDLKLDFFSEKNLLKSI